MGSPDLAGIIIELGSSGALDRCRKCVIGVRSHSLPHGLRPRHLSTGQSESALENSVSQLPTLCCCGIRYRRFQLSVITDPDSKKAALAGGLFAFQCLAANHLLLR